MIVEVATTLFLAWIVWYFVKTYFERRSMPPGPFPYPLVGNLLHLNPESKNAFGNLKEKYGDIFTLDLITKTVVVNTASLAREARLGRHKDDVTGISPESVYPCNILGGDGVIFVDYGTTYLFRKRVFKSAMHVFGEGINRAEERGGYAVKSVLEKIYSFNGQPFSPKEVILSAIVIQLWQWLSSERLTFEDPKLELLLELGVLLTKQSTTRTFFSQMVPFHSYLPIEFNRDIKRAQELISSIFPPVFQPHLETFTPGVIRDLTDSFISAYKKEIAKETGKDIGNIQDIKGLMLDVVFAGSNTTSASLAWFLLCMVSFPEVQKKIHVELDETIDKDDLPRWQDVQNMPYLQATVCEVLRWSPPVPLFGSNILCDITLGGYHIPKRSAVLFIVPRIHHDENEWVQPGQFKPERFLDDEGKFVGWTKLNAFLPFGLGRRECGGVAFAKIMLFIFSATLLHRLKFELPEGAEKPDKEASSIGIVSSPTNFNVVARKRH